MLIPYNTDAPIYHLPVTTVSLIAVNTLIFLATTGTVSTVEEFEAYHWLMLETNTIHPLQWVTNNFMHADIMHLVGNMFFLWAFGLVVEGKLGWWRFLVVYLLIGTIYGALIQVPFFVIGTPTQVCLGASAVIFGLVALAVIWAPKNDLGCFLFILFFVKTVQVPIQVFGGIYLALQLLPMIFIGVNLSSELLHLAGLAVGAPIGVIMLKRGWVDCEGWDLFSVIKGRHTRLASEQRDEGRELLAAARRKQMGLPPAPSPVEPTPSDASRPAPQKPTEQRRVKVAERAQAEANHEAIIERSIADALRSGQPTAALSVFEKQRQRQPGWLPRQALTAHLVNAYLKQQRYREAGLLMHAAIRQDPAGTIDFRLKLAHILLQIENRPRDAAKLLQQAAKLMSPAQRQRANALIQAAKQQVMRAKDT